MAVINTTLADGKVQAVPIKNLTWSLNALKKWVQNRVQEGGVVAPKGATENAVTVSAGVFYFKNTAYALNASSSLAVPEVHATLTKRYVISVPISDGNPVCSTAFASDVEPTVPANSIPLAYVTRLSTADGGVAQITDAEVDNDAKPKLYFPVKPV